MTKKDYKIIAETIKKHYEQNITYYSDYEANIKLSKLIIELCVALRNDNINFDTSKFQIACGFEI